MTATALIDTNVLLYAASNADADREKRLIARQVLTEPEIGFSAQVLQEFYAAAVTKERLKMAPWTCLARWCSAAARVPSRTSATPYSDSR
jgi:predicted nucleic acid-binding protein